MNEMFPGFEKDMPSFAKSSGTSAVIQHFADAVLCITPHDIRVFSLP